MWCNVGQCVYCSSMYLKSLGLWPALLISYRSSTALAPVMEPPAPILISQVARMKRRMKREDIVAELEKRPTKLGTDGLKPDLVDRLRAELQRLLAQPQSSPQFVAAGSGAAAGAVGTAVTSARCAADGGAGEAQESDARAGGVPERALGLDEYEDADEPDHAEEVPAHANTGEERLAAALQSAEMSMAAKDSIVGSHLRTNDKTTYDGIILAAVRLMDAEQRRLIMDNPDVYTPTKSRSWIWEHAYLRHSQPKAIFCRICCPLKDGVPGVVADEVKGGRCAYRHYSTSDMISHLATRHKKISEECPQGDGKPVVAYHAEVQKQILRVLVQGFQILDLRIDSLFEGRGAKYVMNLLLPKVRLPTADTVARVRKGLRDDHDVLMKAKLEEAVAGAARCVGEVDVWAAPSGTSYLGLIAHGITQSYERVDLLMYCGELGCKHGAANQAPQRIRTAIMEKVSMQAETLFWMLEADSTRTPANIGPELGLQDARCTCHIYNLSARHLLFYTKRSVDGQDSVIPHENAVVSVVRLCDKIRKVVRNFRDHEEAGRKLEECAKTSDLKFQALQLDSCSELLSTVQMLEKFCYAEPALLAYNHGYGMKHALTEDDFTLARHIIGVLRPLSDATESMQARSAAASQVLPQLYALRADYAADSPISVPAKGSLHEVVEVQHAEILREARDLRKAIEKDIHDNERRQERSKDTLLKSTAVDPRFRLLSLRHICGGSELDRIKEMLVDEVVAAMPSSEDRQGPRLVTQTNANTGTCSYRANKRLRSLMQPKEPAAGPADRSKVTSVLDAYFCMGTNLPDVDTDPLDFYRNAGKPGQATFIEEQLLRPLVRKYLAAPGANNRIERHWRSTRHYLDYTTKSRIAPAIVDDCMVLHYNSEGLGLWPPKPVQF
jgi:hypothetical protein